MKFFNIALIIVVILLTVITVQLKPGIHEPMIIEDADFVFVEEVETQPAQVVQTVAPSAVNTKVQTPVQKPTVVNVNIVQQQPVKTQVNVQPQPKQQQTKINITTATNPTNTNSELLQKVMSNVEKSNQAANKPQQQVVSQTTQKPATQQKPIQTEQPKTQSTVINITPQPQTTTVKKVLTEEEEIIAWNIWHSNVNNYVMQTARFGYVPLGTHFSFSFLVDKFGNISNIKAECSDPNYMNEARNALKPAIAAMQNKAILKFPEGTKRTTAQAKGAFSIGRSNNFYQPGDFSDYERVKK